MIEKLITYGVAILVALVFSVIVTGAFINAAGADPAPLILEKE